MGKQLELYDKFTIGLNIEDKDKKLMLSDSDEVKKDYSLVCEIDASHAGTLINNRIYPPESMQKGIRSWTAPYKKPVLTNHDENSDPIGRVIKAKYINTERSVQDSQYRPILKESDGYGFVRLTVRITDKEAIRKILDGRYDTVSVRMSTNHAFCSICNSDWSKEGPCEHILGTKYDKELAYVTTGDLNYKEVSFVNIPADEFAGVKEALMVDGIRSDGNAEISLYADNPKEKIFVGFDSGNKNLYSLLDDESGEDDDIILHLLDKSNKIAQSNKEDEVKLEELTKDQLLESEVVKQLIDEEVAKKDSGSEAGCDLKLDTLQKEFNTYKDSSVSKEEHDKVVDELTKAKEGSSCNDGADELSKCAGEKDALTAKIKELEGDLSKNNEDNKRLLDESIASKSELQKNVSERLYDLKKLLRKPDVVGIKTPDARDSKVEEFSQRSLESLKDQINDLRLEQEQLIATNPLSELVDSPAAVHVDKTNEVEDIATSEPTTKKETLNKLFGKGV